MSTPQNADQQQTLPVAAPPLPSITATTSASPGSSPAASPSTGSGTPVRQIKRPSLLKVPPSPVRPVTPASGAPIPVTILPAAQPVSSASSTSSTESSSSVASSSSSGSSSSSTASHHREKSPQAQAKHKLNRASKRLEPIENNNNNNNNLNNLKDSLKFELTQSGSWKVDDIEIGIHGIQEALRREQSIHARIPINNTTNSPRSSSNNNSNNNSSSNTANNNSNNHDSNKCSGSESKSSNNNNLAPTSDNDDVNNNSTPRAASPAATAAGGSATNDTNNKSNNNNNNNNKNDGGDDHESSKSKIGSIRFDDLQFVKNIGSGASGTVQQVLHKPTGKKLAMKIISTDDGTNPKVITSEVKTLYKSQNPYIVSFYDAFSREGRIYIVLEYMDIGSFKDVIEGFYYEPTKKGEPEAEQQQQKKVFPEEVLSHVSRQVLKGLRYLHQEQKTIHRDIKPANILLNSKGRVKITDFGMSGRITNTVDNMKNSFQGTVTYMSPERLKGLDHSYNSDIWSLGVCLAECALGHFPFSYAPAQQQKEQEESIGFFDLLAEIVNTEKLALPTEGYSDDFRNFVWACMKQDPMQRPSASDLLKHPFIAKYAHSKFDLGSWLKEVKSKHHHKERELRRRSSSSKKERSSPAVH